MKKFLLFVLAALMVLSLSIPVLAEPAAGTLTITVQKATDGQEYKLYRILDAEVAAGRTADGAGIRYFDISGHPLPTNTFFVKDASGNYSASADALNGSELSANAIAWLKSNTSSFELVDTKTANANDVDPADSSNGILVSFTGLQPGYYFLDTSVGTLVSVTSISPNAVVRDKNVPPTITKHVKGGDASTFVKANTANIDEDLTFKLAITAHKGAEAYVVTDTMDAGLTFVSTAAQISKSGEYTAAISGQVLTITFDQAYLNTITEDTTIEIEYHAKLNENAVIAGDGNVNQVKLAYGHHSGETPIDSTVTKTYKFGLYKVDGDNKIISPATFKLYTEQACTNEVAVVADAGGYRVAKSGETPVTITAGSVEISGLKNGTYWLVEQTAPAGYNKNVTPFSVTISDANNVGTVSGDTYTANSGGASLLNQSGQELPETGSMGTTVLYAAALAMVLGAGALLFARKKASRLG